HHVDDDGPRVGRGGDVEEDQLVGAFGVVPGGALHGVAGVAQRHEAHALDDAAAVHVEARDEPLREHQATASRACASVSRFSYSALPSTTSSTPNASSRCSRRRSASDEKPPAAVTRSPLAFASSSMPARFGPTSVPSRRTSVYWI